MAIDSLIFFFSFFFIYLFINYLFIYLGAFLSLHHELLQQH